MGSIMMSDSREERDEGKENFGGKYCIITMFVRNAICLLSATYYMSQSRLYRPIDNKMRGRKIGKSREIFVYDRQLIM